MSCVDASGYQDAAKALLAKRKEALNINRIVPIIAAVDAAANMLDIASQADSLAQRQMGLAEEQLGHAELSWPCEEGTITDAMQPEPYVPRFDLMVGKAAVQVKGLFAAERKKVQKGFTKYNSGAKRAALDKLCLAEAIAVSDAQQLAYRAEEQEVLAREDLAWNRQLETAAMGKNITTQASGYFGMAAGGLAAQGQAAGNRFESSINQFARAYANYGTASPYVSREYQIEAMRGTSTVDLPLESGYEMSQSLDGEMDMPMTGEQFGGMVNSNGALIGGMGVGDTFSGGVGLDAGTSIVADSTVKEIKVQGRDSRGDRIDITVSGSNIVHTNARDNDHPTTDITGY
jgi:hypothetical protein